MSRSFSISVIFLMIACRSDKGVTAFNSQPEAAITSHSDGDVILEGYLTTFRGSASDPNHRHNQLTATWYVGTEVLCEAAVPESDGLVQCVGVLQPGDNEVTLEVKDAGNATASASVSLTVTPTDAPGARIISPEATGVYYSDQLITFEGILSDGEDDPDVLVGFWSSSIDGELSDVAVEPNVEGEVSGYGLLTEGQHAIELHVEDTTGKTALDSVIVDVGPPNSAPLCDILTPVDGAAGPQGEIVQFTASTSDVDVPSDVLSVGWFSDKDGDLGNSTPNTAGEVLFSFADLSIDTHTVTMTVTDEVGATCSDFVSYTVGTAPQVIIASPTNAETYPEGTTLNFISTVSDLQDQADEVSIEWTLNGVLFSNQGATSSGTAQFSDATLPNGNHVLVVTATDTDGLTDADQINFTVNGLPTPPVVVIEPDPADTSATLTATIVSPSVDPEGATVSYGYAWLKNNVVQPNQTAQTIVSSDTAKGDTWTVRVTPNDGHDDGNYGETSITVQNTAPSLGQVTVSPALGVYNDLVYTCTATVSDPDETPTLSYQWTVNGSATGGNANSLDLNGTGAMPDDTLSCSVTATDGDGASDTASSGNLVIENRAPVLSNLAITPGTGVTTSTSLTCSADVTDVDGELLTADYFWTVGANTYGGTDLILDPNMVAPNDVVTCTVTVTDGYGGSAGNSVSLTVGNTPPTVSGVTLSPSSVYTNDTVTATAIFDDVDGQTVSGEFEWHVIDFATGVDIVAQSGPDVSLSGVSHFDRDDEVYVVVTPNDTVDDGTPVTSASMTVMNTTPSVPVVSLSPGPAIAGQDDLECTVDVPATDADGDALLYTYEWSYSSGVQQTTTEVPDLSDTFLGSGTTAGDWNCEVTPFDGTGYGGSDSASVVVETGCSSLDFDGVSDRVLIDHPDLPSGNDARTFTVWAYAESQADLGNVFSYGNGDHQTQNQRFSLIAEPGVGTLRFSAQNNDHFYGTPFTLNAWHHLALTFDGSLLVLYVDGTEAASTSTTLNTDGGYPLVVASNTTTRADEFFAGQVHALSMWDRALSPSEVVDDRNGASPSGLVAGWLFGTNNLDVQGGTTSIALEGALAIDTCPIDDFDGDGVAFWDDCDDTDPNVTVVQNGLSSVCPGLDCNQINTDGYATGDGYYWIDPDGSGAFEAYCDMTTDGGGWTRIVNDDYDVDACPSGWPAGAVTSTCSRQSSGGNDTVRSATFDAYGIYYEELRGRVLAYQYSSADAFGDFPPNDLNTAYVDGLSITHSPNGSRVHLFSYAMGFGTSSYDDSNCPGVNGGQTPQGFVGGNHHCETGNPTGTGPPAQWFTSNPIYGNTWFQVSSGLSDADVEIRMMASGNSNDEDIAVQELTLYVR